MAATASATTTEIKLLIMSRVFRLLMFESLVLLSLVYLLRCFVLLSSFPYVCIVLCCD